MLPVRVGGSNAASVCFPVIRDGKVAVFELFCCGNAPSATQHGKALEFQSITASTKKSITWYVEKTLTNNPDTFCSILASLTLVCPPTVWLYSSYVGPDLSGASLGLAAAMACLGCRSICVTGFTVALANDADDSIRCIDNLQLKLHGCFKAGVPLMFPLASVKGNIQLSDLLEKGRFYTFSNHYLKGIPYSASSFLGIGVGNLSEAIILAQSI